MTVETNKNFVIITAKDEMVFKDKVTGDILTNKLYLGCNDSADNYEEVNFPIENETEVNKDGTEESDTTSVQT